VKYYKYYKITYNEERDAFETYIYTGTNEYPTSKDYGLELSVKCVPSKFSDEPNFIHFEILKRISRAKSLGYTIIWEI